ncbi:hypothetical protein IZY60_01885 [Lutibacter sp. B2]|nr:hypothetical protein [Lutibacter sp. B2]
MKKIFTFSLLFIFILSMHTYAEPEIKIIGDIKNQEVLRFEIPQALGDPQLTKEQITSLPKDPKVLHENIHTVYDVLQYMISSGYCATSGDTKIKEGDFSWSFNRPGERTIIENKGNCGATANMVNYLLKGDYEEVGFINYSDLNGGHIYNYIKQDNKYYIIDFLQYPLTGYGKLHMNIRELNNLEEYPELCKKDYTHDEFGGLKLIVAYTAQDQIPIAYKIEQESKGFMYFPTGSNINVLYDTPSEDTTAKFIDKPAKVPCWNFYENTADIKIYIDGRLSSLKGLKLIKECIYIRLLDAGKLLKTDEVYFDEEKKEIIIIKENKIVGIPLKGKIIHVNDKEKIMQAESLVIDNKTVSPLEDIVEALGFTFDWNKTQNVIKINKK